MKTVFLDIDGVLLPARAWALPANAETAARLRADKSLSAADAADGIVFDPVAVALVNRLCIRADALVAVHSNWRRTVGEDKTAAKLAGQGIRHMHADWCCPWKFSSQKGHDIGWWLDDNGGRSDPGDGSDALQPAPGFDFVVLDDERVDFYDGVQPPINGDEGFGLAAYRTACGYLGGVDEEMGVWPVSGDDLAVCVQAWGGDRFKAAAWLHAKTWRNTPARRLMDARTRQGALSDLPEAVGAASGGVRNAGN